MRRKERAVRAHKSQMRLLSRFLLAFVRENELYSPLPVPAREALAAEEEGWAVLPERGRSSRLSRPKTSKKRSVVP